MKLLRFRSEGQEKPGVLLNDEILDVSSFGAQLAAPITRPSKIVCVGLNYWKHAAESKMPVPSEPILFFKSTTSFTGPNDEVVIPKNSKKTDWEVELAVVIGKRATDVDEADAMKHVAGFCLHNGPRLDTGMIALRL